jgi:hypothetical protein
VTAAGVGRGRDTQKRRLRAWRLRGEPVRTRPQEPPPAREAVILDAHRAGVLVLGGGSPAAAGGDGDE